MEKTITLPCATAGCTGHVVYDPTPLPALTAPTKSFKVTEEKQHRVYLTCDNTITGPHKNMYLIP